MDEKGGKKILIGVIIALVLIVIFVIFILPGLALVNISGSREAAYDTQIGSELSQLRSRAEQYYYEDDSYLGFDSSNKWKEISTEIPDCTGHDSYQINISDEEYVIWSPLCSEDGFECIDSKGTAEYFEEKVGEGYNCYEMFN